MKVEVELDNTLNHNQIRLKCTEFNTTIKRIKSYIEKVNQTIRARTDESSYFIKPEEIYYIESVDKKVFVYLKDQVLESSLKLYEIEQLFLGLTFFRASKSTIVNVKYIKKTTLMINRNLTLTLENNERIILSRRNIKNFQKFIGME